MVDPRVFIFVGLIAAGLADSEDSGNLKRDKKDVAKLQSIAASLMGGYLPSRYSPTYSTGYYPGGGYSNGYSGGYSYSRGCDCRSQYGLPTGFSSTIPFKFRPQAPYPPPPPPPSSDDTVVVYPRPATTYGVPVSQQTSIRLAPQPSLPPPPPPPPAPSSFVIGTSFGGSPSPGFNSGPPPPPPPPPVVTYQRPVVVASPVTTNVGPSGYSYDRPAVPFKF